MASAADEDVFESRQPKGLLWFSIIALLVVLGLGIYDLFSDQGIGWSDGLFLFFMTPLLLDVAAMGLGPPILRLDSAGIRYRRLSKHVIPWDHIATVKLTPVWGLDGISIGLKDGMRLPPTRWFGLQRLLHKVVARGDFRLQPDLFSHKLDVIADAIERVGRIPVSRAR